VTAPHVAQLGGGTFGAAGVFRLELEQVV